MKPRIVIEVGDGGQFLVNSNVDVVIGLGMLEMAKAALIKQATEKPALVQPVGAMSGLHT